MLTFAKLALPQLLPAWVPAFAGMSGIGGLRRPEFGDKHPLDVIAEARMTDLVTYERVGRTARIR
ncbi:MAG TPA: hypothetical protein VN805_17545, partial [Caulobacteraceae bacterium]|nr:hypothetical protein [Caulobacteraceae bacterium]